MGEIAEAMINGGCCSWCNVYFEQDHGYPVACKSCWEEPKKFTKDFTNKDTFKEIGIQKAIHKEL